MLNWKINQVKNFMRRARNQVQDCLDKVPGAVHMLH